jgi:hypothetical protein
MQSLTKDAEAKIQTAIEQLCRDTDDCSAAQLKSAAVKVARQHGFGPDMIRLMTIGYNNGMATYTREKGAGILEKLAEFPLLNADEVISSVYTGSAKAAAAVEVSAEYSVAPRNQLSPELRRREALCSTSLVKLAGMDPVVNTLEDSEEDELGDGDAIRLLGQADRLKREIKTARARWSDAYEDLKLRVLEVRNYFKQASYNRDWSFGHVQYAVNHKFGESGSNVMELLKQASGHTVDTATPPTKPINWSAQPFAQIADCVKLANETVKLQRQWVDVAIDNRCKIAELMMPFRRAKVAEPVAPESILCKHAVAPGAVNFAVVAGALKNLMGSSMQPASRDDLVRGTLNDLQDPDHEEDLRRIRAQTMLQQFLTDDPVLSGHEPDRVMSAFNELSSLSPRTSQQPAAARSILRKWVTQGAVEPFEAREVTDLERNLGDIQGSNQSKAPAMPAKEKMANVLTRRSRLVVG